MNGELKIMRTRKIVHFKPIVGSWQKLFWGNARDKALSSYDRSPLPHDMKVELLNNRLKGATIQEFIKEREDAKRLTSLMAGGGLWNLGNTPI